MTKPHHVGERHVPAWRIHRPTERAPEVIQSATRRGSNIMEPATHRLPRKPQSTAWCRQWALCGMLSKTPRGTQPERGLPRCHGSFFDRITRRSHHASRNIGPGRRRHEHSRAANRTVTRRDPDGGASRGRCRALRGTKFRDHVGEDRDNEDKPRCPRAPRPLALLRASRMIGE